MPYQKNEVKMNLITFEQKIIIAKKILKLENVRNFVFFLVCLRKNKDIW